MLSLAEQTYFFDSLREASAISKKGKKVREGKKDRQDALVFSPDFLSFPDGF